MNIMKFATSGTFARKWMWLMALLLLACAAASAHPPVWSAVGSFGGSGDDGLGAAKTDALGNLYVTGFFSATATFQNKVLISYGDADMFLAKFGPRGRLLWIVQAGGVGLDEGTDLAFDADGNVYVTGWFSDSATFHSANGESKIVNGYVHENVFLAKYSPGGQLVWLRTGGSLDFDTGNNRDWGVAVNPKTGTIYMTGFAEGTTNFSTTTGPVHPVTGTFGWHMYLVKYDTQGNFRWGVANVDGGNTIAYKVAFDKYDAAYVVGWFEGGITFASRDGKNQTFGAFSQPGGPDYADDAFLAKYDCQGNLKWVNHAGGYKAIANNLAVNDDGRITITGLVGNISDGSASQAQTIITSEPAGATVSLGSGQLTNPYNWDILLATYDCSGLLKRATRIGGTSRDFGTGITYDRDGNLYVTGFFSGTVDFGGQTLNGSAPNNVFVVKYRHLDGKLAWARLAPGAGFPDSYQETGPRVWVEECLHPADPQGHRKHIVVGGPYPGTATFGSFQFNSAGADDIYVMKINVDENVE